MATATEKLHILVVQHLEHIGVAEDVVGKVKDAFEQGGKAKAEGSTLYELFSSATGGGKPQQQNQPPMQQARGGQPMMQTQRTGSMPAAGSTNNAGSTYNATQMPQQAPPSPQKPVIAKEPEQRNINLDQQLMNAAKSGAVDTIPGLINSGAYVNYQDNVGNTPLLAATEADKAAVCRVLLENGADVNLARPDGTSPLLCAYKGNKKKVLKELTAGAFRTLNSAVHQTGNIGTSMSYFPEQDEGVTDMDICQAKEETGKLFQLQAHPVPQQVRKTVAREETMVNIGGPADMSDLRQGGVRLLMQELQNVSRKIA